MTTLTLFQFPRLFAIPNVSPFCCKMETWLRIAGLPYEVVDTTDPRKGPKGKMPFIEDGALRLGDTALIIDHLKKTRGVDPDAHLDADQRATALVVQRTIEEHYVFVALYTHFIGDEGWRKMRHTFAVPAFIRPFVATMIRDQMRKILKFQGVGRHTDNEIMKAARRDWQAVATLFGGGPFFFGAEPATVDATLFGALATTLRTPIPSPIRDFLQGQPKLVAHTEHMRQRFFPEFAG